MVATETHPLLSAPPPPVRLPSTEYEPTPPQTVVIPYDYHTRTSPNGVSFSDILAREINEVFPGAKVEQLTQPSLLQDFTKAGYSETASFIPPLEITELTAERLIAEAVSDPAEQIAMKHANDLAKSLHTGQIRRSDKRAYFTGHCTVAAAIGLIHAMQSRKHGIPVPDGEIALEYEVLVAHDIVEDGKLILEDGTEASQDQLITYIRNELGNKCTEQILVMTKDKSITDGTKRNSDYVSRLEIGHRGIQRKMIDNMCNNGDDLMALLTDPGADFARIRKSLHKSIEEYGPAFHDRWMQTNNPMNKQLYKQWWTVTQLALHALEKRERELHLGADSSGHNGVIPTGQNGSVCVS
jgi:hypothetical protein